MTHPLISAICPTYARFPHYQWMLDESVYWFTRQTWPTKELVILNDDPGQTLVCDVPGVRILNLPVRCPSLGFKYQLMLEAARGVYCLPWEDDDISLPHRMEQAADHLKDGFDFWNPQSGFFQSGRDGVIHKNHPHGVLFNGSAFRTEAFRGKYPAVMADKDGNPWVAAGHANQDAIADGWAKANLKSNRTNLVGRPDKWSYCYRFGITHNHYSGIATDPRTADQVWRDVPPGPPGTYTIVPRQRIQYDVECAKVAVGGL